MNIAESQRNLLSLPSEILCQIFYFSREPAFVHVCRRTWKELPSFFWYSKRLAALALYKPITDHVYSEDAIEFPALLTLPEAEYPLPEHERINLQERLLCSYWFTENHLIRVSRHLMLAAISVALKMLEISLTPLQAAQLQHAVEKVHQDWKAVQAIHRLRYHTSWFPANSPGVPGFDIYLNALTLVIRESSVDQYGKRVISWRQQDQHISAESINVPILPPMLIEQLAQRNERSFRLLSALYIISKTDPYLPRANLKMPLKTQLAIDISIRHMLKEDFATADSDDRHLRLLLLFDYYLNPAELPCKHRIQTELEKASIWINERHYGAVIREGNTNGLRRLLKLNPGTCSPLPFRMKKMLNEARTLDNPHAKESLDIYTQARQEALAARQVLKARTRNSLLSRQRWTHTGENH